MEALLELLKMAKDLNRQLDELGENQKKTTEQREALVKTLCPFGA